MLDKFIPDLVSIDELRPWLTHPHEIGGFVYISNGHICLKSPASNFSQKFEPVEGEKVPNFEGIREQAIPLITPVKLHSYKIEECLSALPKHPKRQVCTTCLGCGEVECSECGHEHECRDCKGAGGIGPVIGEWYGSYASIQLGKAIFGANYIDLLLKIAEALKQEIEVIRDSTNGVNIFKLSDTEVWIAPRTEKDMHHVSYEYRQLEAA